MYVDWTLLVFSGNHPKLPLFMALPLALSTQLKRRSNLLELVLSASESGRHRPTCQHTSLQEIFLKNSKKIRVTPMDPFLRPLNHFLSKYEWEKWKFWPFWSLGDPKNEKRPKKGFLGILKDPQAYPDFFRIFTFFIFFDILRPQKHFVGPKKGCLGLLGVPRSSPDFFRVFLNFHIYQIRY